MNDAQFDKLWNHFNERFDVLDTKLEKYHDEVSGIYTHLDEVKDLLTTDETERAAQNLQLDRHEEAIEDHATRLGRLEQKAA